MLSPLYMAEISPPEVRGSLMALEQFSIVLGAVLGFWTGYFTRDCESSAFHPVRLLLISIPVPGSASWRTPLGIQIIPGMLLAIGSVFLPASPRLLVSHGRYDEALRSLARLRRRTQAEATTDPLLQVELLEMRAEALLVDKIFGATSKEGTVRAEARAWGQLFSQKYIKRTFIGIMMMFFQRRCQSSPHCSVLLADLIDRMERYQRIVVLWTYFDARNWFARGQRYVVGIWRYWYRAVPRRVPDDHLH